MGYKMAGVNHSVRLMEEVQKYENLYNKFSRDYKDKYLRVNWMQRKQKRNTKTFEPQIGAFAAFSVVFSDAKWQE